MSRHTRFALVAFLAGILGLCAADAPEKAFFATDFTEAKLAWTHVGKGLVEVALANGPVEGAKALRLHFKFDAPNKGWPQSQHHLKEPFVPQGDFIVEFDAKVNHPGNYVPLKFELIPFGSYEGKSLLPFIDEGLWRKVRIRFKARPGKEGTQIKSLLFTVGRSQQKAGDETIFTIANLKLYPAQP